MIHHTVHHLEHLLVYSALLWQVVLAVYLLLKWLNENFKIEKIIDSPHIYSGIETSRPTDPKNVGAVEVDVNKNVIVGAVDFANVKSDEVIKTKVKTKKNKLKDLRK